MIKKVNETLKIAEGHTHKIPIGIDEWVANYEETFQGKDIIIQSNDDIVNLAIEHNHLSARQLAELLYVAWYRGYVDTENSSFPEPKDALPIGGGKMINYSMQKVVRKRQIENKDIEYKPYIGIPNFGIKNDHSSDETQRASVKFYVDSTSDKGVEYIKHYLAHKIPSEIKNRLTQLKAAGKDYKTEAKLLKKEIDKIVKELS